MIYWGEKAKKNSTTIKQHKTNKTKVNIFHPFPICIFRVTPVKLEAEQLYDS